jgi:hypothetical protein
VRNVLLVLADAFHQFFVRKKIEPREIDSPRFRICLWVVDGELQAYVPELVRATALHMPDSGGLAALLF